MTINDIIKNHVLEEIFTAFPTHLEEHPYDFFMRLYVECAEFVVESPLGKDWGYEVSEAYGLENIRAIRDIMLSMSSDLVKLKLKLFQHAVKRVMISKDDFKDENEFYDFVQKANAALCREGTVDEYATVLTVTNMMLDDPCQK